MRRLARDRHSVVTSGVPRDPSMLAALDRLLNGQLVLVRVAVRMTITESPA